MGLDLGTVGTFLGKIGNSGIFANTGADIFDLGALAFGGTGSGGGGNGGSPPFAGTIGPTNGGGGGIDPGFPGAALTGCESDPRNQYVLKFLCGQWKWVKKQKRRRKRLATPSDIKDLSSLKGVLGGGKSFDLWIATHA